MDASGSIADLPQADSVARWERRWFTFADRLDRYASPIWLPAIGRWLGRNRRFVPLTRVWLLRAIVYCHRFRLTTEQLGTILAPFALADIQRAFAHDAWYCNKFVNVWEYEHGVAELQSYPCDVSIPIADICNARCTFCTSWIEGTRMLDLAELDAFEPVIRHAHAVGLAGHGEPLSHPQLPAILDRLERWLDARARAYVITNGVYLDRYLQRLLDARVGSFAISLNAATPETHKAVMGFGDGAFDAVVASIRKLVALRDDPSENRAPRVSISQVLTRQNIHETAEFVRLGEALEVDEIQLKTLAGAGGVVVGLNYHELPPYDHPDYERHKGEALRAIAASTVPVTADPESWDTRVFPAEVEAAFKADPPPSRSRAEVLRDPAVRQYYASQEKLLKPSRGELVGFIDDRDGDNPYGRTPRFNCRAPYYFLYINDFSYNMSPCCYMGKVPGHAGVTYDGSFDFFEAWNSPAMVALRTRLRDGPLFRMCGRCPGVY
jgi:MoaA/NifB/PqqE/SkfB family radical SAM enzyme